MKNKLLITILASTLLLSGCAAVDNGEYYSFNDIAGIETSNIIDFKVSESIYTSFAWQYQYDDYSFLNTKYEKVDFSIKAEIFDKEPSDGGDAITIHLMTDILLETYPTQNYSFNMYISYADYHLYYGSTIEGATNAYRSKNRISDKYISLLKDQRNRDGAYLLRVSGNSNASPDLPKTGHYAPGHKFSFKVEHVTDLTFYAYLNKELLTPVKDDGTLGGYSFYEFEMPSQDSALVITSDEFYVYRPYSFAEVFSWVNAITKDTLKGVRIEDGYIGVDPETANPTIKYSEDERDIDYNLMVLEKEPLVKTGNQHVPGGTYRLVTYVLNNSAEYEIEINNGHVIYRDFDSYQEFRFDSTPTNMPDVFYPESD